MVTFDEYSRMVTAIHAAAITPEHWIDAMTTVRRSLDANACGMIIADGSSRLIKTASLPEEAKADYLDYYRDIDYVLEAVDKSPVGMINDGQELIALNARSEFNIDWMRPYDLQDGIFVRLTGEVDPTTFLLAAPLRDDAFATAERVRAINALIPTSNRHCARRTTSPACSWKSTTWPRPSTACAAPCWCSTHMRLSCTAIHLPETSWNATTACRCGRDG